MILNVDGAEFAFPDHWDALKYDDSAFYKGVFMKVHDGIKAVDVLAVERSNVAGSDARVVLIEVKDYRHANATGLKPSELADAVARKVTATLAGVSVASRRAIKPTEKDLATRSHTAPRVEVVLHCEDRPVPIVDPSELAIALSNRLRTIVDRVSIGSARRSGGPWSVTMPEL